MSLRDYQAVRSKLTDIRHVAESRKVSGSLSLSPELFQTLRNLQDKGHIEARLKNGQSFDFTLHEGSVAAGTVVMLELNPLLIHHYESVDQLLRYCPAEPNEYFVEGIGFCKPDSQDVTEIIAAYRDMLRAKQLLKCVADLKEASGAIFMTPEKLVIPFRCRVEDLGKLDKLAALEGELADGAVEKDQRVMLFKRSLRDHLRSHPVEEHFGLFLRNFESIYDSYRRDFELWLGTTFGEIEKSFEEKRLKFVTDLNGILGSIQASILAVPLAAVVVIDKFEAEKTIKNTALAGTAFFVGFLALKLLQNQQHTLDATSDAIRGVREDFEKKKHNYRKAEFTSRMESILKQERRVQCLLCLFRIAIWTLMTVGFCIWLYTLFWAFPGKAVPDSP